ncbi:MAG: glycosyltransferase family 2 protein [Owenweeksia sp.]|nr:glycosyltransferase family 2 protein [Owenweeksia sp.]
MPDNPKKIAVVILNWNGLKLMKRFLANVVVHSQDLAQVYVIDNDSQDESRDWLKIQHPEVSLIELPANYGYAGGYNRGLAEVKEPYALLLNSDVKVTESWLQPLLNRMEENPQLAAIQPKVLDLKNPQYFEYAGACGGFLDYLGYPYCRGRLFETLEKDNGQYDDYREVFWATGAALMVNLDSFKQAGQLNESLFAHMEEIDLCWRLQLQGYHVACEPQSVVYHLGGGTLDKLSPHKTFLNFRNSLIIMFLNLPHSEALLKIMTRLMLDAVAALRFLFMGKSAHIIAIFKAHFSFYQRFAELAKKKQYIRVKPLAQLNGVYPRSVVKEYFIAKKVFFRAAVACFEMYSRRAACAQKHLTRVYLKMN